jgi:hypothetical protein
MQPPADEAKARNRFIALSAMRVTGVAMVLFGLAITAGKIALPMPAAYVLIGLGMVEAFVMPLVFARLWSSERR